MAASLPSFAFRGRTIEVDAPHLAFATAIAGWSAWFCQDAWRAQHDVENLILIVPASAAALVLYAFVAAGCFRAIPRGQVPVPARRPLEPGIGVKIVGTMAMLGAYALAGPLIGFDVATFAYILAMLLFLGERRIVILVLVPVLFCAVVIYSFGTLLATPLPLLFFGGDAS
jgi:hypothetical protein